MANSQQPRRQNAQSVQEPGLLSRILTQLLQSMLFLLATLVLAIILEWLGMVFIWPHQGSRHSAFLLANALTYLHDEVTRSLLVEQPLQFAQYGADRLHYYLFQQTGIERGLRWLAMPAAPAERHLHTWVRLAYHFGADYILAAVQVTSLFAVRFAILILSLPAVILFVLVAMIDGLVQRDIRRWSGGRESAFIYHWAKKFLTPALVLPCLVYLALPITIHPNLIILPCAVVFALAVKVMAATFKKYL